MHDDVQSLRHICNGLFTDVATGRQIITRMEIHNNGSESWTILVIGDGEPHRAHLLPEQFAWWRDTLFPPPPPDGNQVKPGEIVKLDGTPRNKLLDRWRQRRRTAPSDAMAAD